MKLFDEDTLPKSFDNLGHVVPKNDIDTLAILASQLKRMCGRVDLVEVGSFAGLTASALKIMVPCDTVTCIDLWNGSLGEDRINSLYSHSDAENAFDKNTYGLDIKKLKWGSLDAAEIYDWPVNFVFIDASHDYESVSKDIRAWAKALQKNCQTRYAILAGHDYGKVFPGVVDAVKDNLGKENIDFMVSGFVWWTTYIKTFTQCPPVIPLHFEEPQELIKCNEELAT